MILTITIAASFLYFFWRIFQRKRVADFMLKNFKSPPTYPLVGHPSILKISLNLPGIFELVQECFKDWGKNWVFVRPLYSIILLISDPKDIEKLLTDPNSKKADAYSFLIPWLGTGLLTSWGEKWFQRRKVITPTFHFNILEGFAEIMSKQSDIFVQNLKPLATNEDINIYKYSTLFAIDVVCETAMGVSIKAQSSPNSEYVQAVKDISAVLQKRFFSIFGQLKWIYNLTPNGRRHKKLISILHQFTNEVITKRREQLLNQIPMEPNEGKVRINFLDMLLKSTIDEKPLTNADIREEVDTFMFEGHDTTTSGMAFAFYHLSRHKDIQDRLYDELVDVLGEVNTSDITYQSIANLPYLDMVVKESLRICPSVPFIGRKLTEDTVLDGTTVPTGTEIFISIYALHHDPHNFPDPEKFDPERFDLTQTTNRHPFTYIPFSAGSRNCIGQKFALMELKLVIAKLIMNFEFLPATELPVLQGDLILKAAKGIFVKIANRQKINKINILCKVTV